HNWKTSTNSSGKWFFNNVSVTCSCNTSSINHSPLFNFSNSAWNTYHHVWLTVRITKGLFNVILHHGNSRIIISNNPILHWTNGCNTTWGSTDHVSSIFTYRDNFIGLGITSNN